MAFPSSVPSYTGFTSTHTLSQDQHASQHNAEQADIVALAQKVGTGSSTPVNNTVLRGNGTGTTAYGLVRLDTDTAGVLGTSNGGTGQTSLTSVPLVSPSITGGGSWTGAPVLSGPTIGDFTNANHNHQTTSGGGLLGTSAFAVGGLASDRLTNPYKFSVYLSSNFSFPGNFAATKINIDTKIYDTSSNVDVSSNRRFIAPIAGFYHFSGSASFFVSNSIVIQAFLYKNGSQAKQGNEVQNASGGNLTVSSQVSGDIQLAANDYVELYAAQNAGANQTLNGGASVTYFDGFLISAT